VLDPGDALGISFPHGEHRPEPRESDGLLHEPLRAREPDVAVVTGDVEIADLDHVDVAEQRAGAAELQGDPAPAFPLVVLDDSLNGQTDSGRAIHGEWMSLARVRPTVPGARPRQAPHQEDDQQQGPRRQEQQTVRTAGSDAHRSSPSIQ
jgi:hypothetical protein